MASVSKTDFINRYLNKVIFSDAPNLNIGVRDMGAEQTTPIFNDEAITELKTATGITMSLNLFITTNLKISVKKTSPVADYYGERYFANAYIGGSITLYDDVGRSYTGLNPAIKSIDLGQLNGSSPTFDVVITCVLEVNKQALTGF